MGRLATPAKKLEDTIRLAELVIEVLQQNEEHHAEVSVLVHMHIATPCPYSIVYVLHICLQCNVKIKRSTELLNICFQR